MKLTPEQKEANKKARQEARKQAKELARINAEKNQKPVKRMELSIEWRKSRMWGNNPHLEASIWFHDGTFEKAYATCSGCGYDKESTVVGDIFNRYLKYKLWKLDPARVKNGGRLGDDWTGKLPYGIHSYSENHWGFGQGVGMSCYPAIAEAIGGKLERTASGKTYDHYVYTDL